MDSETWRATRPIALAGLLLLGTLLALLIILQLRQLLAVIFLGFVLGITLNPFVEFMSRYRVPRVAAILFIYLVTALLLAGFMTYAAYEISTTDFETELDDLRADYDELREGTPLPRSQRVEEGIQDAGSRVLNGVAGQVPAIVSAFGAMATVLFTAVMFSITQARMRDVGLSFIRPEHRPRAEQYLSRLAIGIRGYVRGEAISMLVIGVVTYIGLMLLGIKLAAVLAFIAFIFELLPMIGPWIAFIPALAVSLTDGFWAAVQVTLLYAGIQAFESYVVLPLVHGRHSEMPALLIFVAVAIGGVLMGVLGALIALPLAVILYITYFEFVQPWNERRFHEDEFEDEPESPPRLEPVAGRKGP
jgi:predicted PurR-regulated permease PerM